MLGFLQNIIEGLLEMTQELLCLKGTMAGNVRNSVISLMDGLKIWFKDDGPELHSSLEGLVYFLYDRIDPTNDGKRFNKSKLDAKLYLLNKWT